MLTEDDKIIWQAHPSQLVNLPFYVAGALYIIGVVALQSVMSDALAGSPFLGKLLWVLKGSIILVLFGLLYRFLSVALEKYTLTEKVFRHQYGILNRIHQELELFRVNDVTIIQPFYLGMFGYAVLRVDSSDASSPVTYIAGVKNAESIRASMRTLVQDARQRPGLFEMINN